MKKKKALRVPVTQGLKNIFAMDMHTAYQAACMGHFSVTLFSRLAVAISVIRIALEQKNTMIEGAIEILDTAIETLTVVRSRGDETDIWELTESERPTVLAGIVMVEQCIGTLDVALLTQISDMLLATSSGGREG